MKPSTILSFVALALPFANATPLHNKRHHEVANRARADVEVHKRNSFTNAHLTWYEVGLGACGKLNYPGDYIVALNVEQYGPGYPGDYCFKTITIRVGGVTATATITDKCMGCHWGALDLSPGLFSHFSSQSVGVLYGEWWFND